MKTAPAPANLPSVSGSRSSVFSALGGGKHRRLRIGLGALDIACRQMAVVVEVSQHEAANLEALLHVPDVNRRIFVPRPPH